MVMVTASISIQLVTMLRVSIQNFKNDLITSMLYNSFISNRQTKTYSVNELYTVSQKNMRLHFLQ